MRENCKARRSYIVLRDQIVLYVLTRLTFFVSGGASIGDAHNLLEAVSCSQASFRTKSDSYTNDETQFTLLTNWKQLSSTLRAAEAEQSHDNLHKA